MAQTLVRLSTHAVFSTKERRNLIMPDVEPDLYAYLSGILKNLASPCIEVNGTANHLHVLFLQSKSGCFSDTVFYSTGAICGAKALRRFQRRMVYGGGQPAASPAKSAAFAAGYTL